MQAVTARGPTVGSLRTGLGLLGVVLLGVALLELVLLAEGGVAPLWVLSLFLVQGLVWAGTGLLAWSRRPSNRTGLLLVLGGLSFLVVALLNTASQPLAAAASLVTSLPLALAVHVLLAFPSGRVRERPARATVGAAYAVALLGPLPGRLFAAGGPASLADVPALAALSRVLQPLGIVVALAAAALLVGRLRRACPPQRRTLGPLYAYGVLSVLGVALAARLQELLGLSDLVRFVAQSAALVVVPVAFGAVLLRGGFARAGVVEELPALLEQHAGTAQEVLARALGDPTLELLHWLPAERRWVDGAGRPRRPPGASPERGVVEVEVAGRRAGALVYDAGLIPDPELVRAAARPAGLALEAERLEVELRRSRARLVAAADDERRRLARDLHDGLQVRLVLLALEAGTLATRAVDQEVARDFERLRRDVDEAAHELRRTVQSLLPAALVERGLAAAVEDLVDRLPVPARLDLGTVPEALPEDTATTAWYVVTESITNALRHAAATRLEVRVGLEDGHPGGPLVVEVGDDGIGGADVLAGSGLRGLADRLDVVDGRLRVDSPPGAGTRVRAELPVAA